MSGLTILLIGKMLLFYLVMTGVMYMTGSGVSKLLGIRTIGLERLSIGFVFQLALIQLFGWCFMAFGWSTTAFSVQVLLISLAGILLGFYGQAYKTEQRSFDKSYLLSAGMLLLQIILTLVMYRSDADDSFYVSNVTLFQNSQALNSYDASFGITSLGTVPMYDFETWEAYAAVLGNFFRIEGVTLMHFALVPWLLLMSASAYFLLGRRLFNGELKKSNYFYVLLSVFHLMGGNAVFSQGSFLLSRIWQGKAVYLHVVLPVMMVFLLCCIGEKRKEAKDSSEKLERYLFVLLFACILAGAALNPTSLYVLGFQLAAMLIVVAIYNKKAKLLLHGLPAVCIVAFFTLLIYFRASRFTGQIEAASGAGDDFVLNVFKNFFGSGLLYFLLYGFAVVVVLFLGNRQAKTAFVFTPVVLFAGVWNPIAGKVVAETLTKVPSYWRVFWLIPVGLAISYAMIILSDRFKYQGIGVLVGCVLMIVPGTWMFSEENHFFMAENIERLPQEVMLFGPQAIAEKERPVILSSDALSTTFRQKYEQVELIYSRYQYILDLFTYRGQADEGAERLQLMRFSNGQIEEEAQIANLLEKYSVDYVIVKKEYENSCQLVESNQWRVMDESDEYIMYSAPI
ncbi:DUF6077 domain-containing protein [Enterococcus sp. BWR-S5]|uniref:DUF6077 domain-containing protein n=1 Tax=Enterococcus sp. BWR-S5 TaxID=2787714 RepID=UPI001924E1BA|nr:DUF6077 domain-containing protein [Enterococcus sp. BWR-S5]MBL1226714.1 hypothetical protein [Enterococcus sp. BWR-S5]